MALFGSLKQREQKLFVALIAGKFQAEGARALGCFRRQGCTCMNSSCARTGEDVDHGPARLVAIHYDTSRDGKLAIRPFILLAFARRQRITAQVPTTLLGAHRLQPFDPHLNWAASWSPEALKHRSLRAHIPF